ncbi:MAG: YutD family protein, partial [Lactiplantibacillus plantarum]|nr:YutD family protein [Lactiplantibacillus plantarum]
VQRSQTIGAVQDYLYEYCNFGCAYFIIKNERVIKPKRTSRSRKDDRRGKKNTNSRQSRARSNRNSSRSKQRRKSHSFTTKQKAAPFTEKRRQPAKVTAGNGKQAQTTKQSSGKRHFTIRQK